MTQFAKKNSQYHSVLDYSEHIYPVDLLILANKVSLAAFAYWRAAYKNYKRGEKVDTSIPHQLSELNQIIEQSDKYRSYARQLQAMSDSLRALAKRLTD